MRPHHRRMVTARRTRSSRVLIWALAIGLATLISVIFWQLPVTSEPASVLAHGPAVLDVLALGDSVPAGSACGCEPFPALYVRDLTPDGQATDLAQPGFTSGDVLSQIYDPTIQPAIRSASIIVIMIGANDLATVFSVGGDTATYQQAAATAETNVAATLRHIRTLQAAPVFVLGYWNVVEDGDAARGDYSDADTVQAATITGYTNDALHMAAIAGSATFVPTMPAFKGSDGTSNPTGLLAEDGDHPNARGHAAIAAALYAAQPTATR